MANEEQTAVLTREPKAAKGSQARRRQPDIAALQLQNAKKIIAVVDSLQSAS